MSNTIDPGISVDQDNSNCEIRSTKSHADSNSKLTEGSLSFNIESFSHKKNKRRRETEGLKDIMTEASKKRLCSSYKRATYREIRKALIWAEAYKQTDGENGEIMSSYMIASLVYLYETGNGFPNTIGKALCEIFILFNEEEAQNVLNRFKLPLVLIYNNFKEWEITAEIPVVFSVKVLSEAYDVLHYAVLNDDTDMVHWLLQFNIDVDKKDSEGKTALHVAASTGKNLIIHCLLEFGASLYYLDQEQNTPLEAALLHRHFEAAKLLKPELLCNFRMDNSETLLMKLIRQDLTLQVKYMLPFADFSIVNSLQQNVLHVCAFSEHAKAIGMLLSKIPFNMIDARDMDNHTPLYLALREKKNEMVEQLVVAGANIFFYPELMFLH